MTRHRAGVLKAVPNVDRPDMPADLPAVLRDDELLDQFRDPDHAPGGVLAAWRREVRTGSDRQLLDSDTALAAMRAGAGRAVTVAVALLAVVIMIGASLAVLAASLVNGLVSAVVWGLVLVVAVIGLAAGYEAWRERRR